MWNRTNLYAWTHSEHDWIIAKWWTLCGKKEVYFSTYTDRQARDKGENTGTFNSLKDAKQSFHLVPLSPHLVPETP